MLTNEPYCKVLPNKLSPIIFGQLRNA